MTHRRRYDKNARVDTRDSGDCPLCGRSRYQSRKAAKAAARLRYPGRKFRAIECGGFWHFGQLPDAIRSQTPGGECFAPGIADWETRANAKREALRRGGAWFVKPCEAGHWHVLRGRPPAETKSHGSNGEDE